MTLSTHHRTHSNRVERPSATGAPAALLLHGLSGSPVEMHHLARCLRQSGFEVHIPAIPGYGFGTRTDPFDTGTWEQWVAYASGALDILSQRHERIYLAGLCIGAVLALRLAMERPKLLSALSLISITLEHDGWATPWYRRAVRLACHTPLRRHTKLHERFPYGLKNERLRERVARAMRTEGSSAAGAEFLPLSGMHQAYRLSAAVQRDIARVTTPSLVLHAIDDDVASTRSAQFVARNIKTPEVRTILYRESYHILTMDNDREAVADETIGFFRKYGAPTAAPEQDQVQNLLPAEAGRETALAEQAGETQADRNTWMPGMGQGPDFGSNIGDEGLQLGLPGSVAEV